MGRKVLQAIVCGYERGGTTLLSQLLTSHTKLETGFESGLLLAPEPKNFKDSKFSVFNGSMIKNGWGITEEDLDYILLGRNWNQVYLRLRARSKVIKNKNSLLIDKTPRYMLHLSDVLYRMDQVPCVVIVKEPKGVIWSWIKRQKGLDVGDVPDGLINKFCKRYVDYAHGYAEAKRNHPLRILKVNYSNLCENPVLQSRKIFEHVGLDFDEKYLTFEQKYEVHGTNISDNYIHEYQEKLSKPVIAKIENLTEKAEEFLSV